MAKIELQRPLSVPAIPARSAISSILHDIAEGRGQWADFALYCTFGSIGLPDVGYIAIPVKISNLDEHLEPRHEIRFHMQASREPQAFPLFDGSLGIDVSGASSSTLWLAGTYEVPLSGLGALLNQTMMRGTAEKTISNMIDVLAEGTVARVQKHEIAETRYRLLLKSGD